ncbi:BZ3500_MvSof-1268-A1-R1_Chr7-1g09365 [Microbotryum saponariae]|uniref:Mitochondrial import inner membrane translocase subunit n=1 Tax=Microbotryum saponariae TaxID=289078 RepID=A0A2X0L8Z9_9BASI|nr:BZ3501_MvSof-1269-A2-R1_Chr7-1g09070 [Microbotryum saponariae]SDA03301.1 BZ3500_MvSof-1268-A1-R1_Chr7-1g09365 [Microbotryum saponariae]
MLTNRLSAATPPHPGPRIVHTDTYTYTMSAPQAPASTEQFDAATQRELQAFLEQEQTKARLQTSIHTFTDMCWDKCITGSIGGRFSRGEESCLVNCVDRFLDTSLFIVKNLESRRGAL